MESTKDIKMISNIREQMAKEFLFINSIGRDFNFDYRCLEKEMTSPKLVENVETGNDKTCFYYSELHNFCADGIIAYLVAEFSKSEEEYKFIKGSVVEVLKPIKLIQCGKKLVSENIVLLR